MLLAVLGSYRSRGILSTLDAGGGGLGRNKDLTVRREEESSESLNLTPKSKTFVICEMH